MNLELPPILEPKPEAKKHTSDLLEGVIRDQTADTMSLEEIKHALHERGFGVLMAIAALPLCIPIPSPPFYSTLFSLPLFIFSIQLIYGSDSPWLPSWLMRKQIKRKTLALMVEKAAPTLRRIEKLLKPRWSFAGSRTGERVIGVMAFLFTFIIAMPIPFANLLPGYGILIMSLGLLSKDGITILLGMLVGMIGVVLAAIVVFLGTGTLLSIFHWLGF